MSGFDLAKLNRAGVGGTTFGSSRKTSGTSKQAAKNLSNSGSATKTTKFSLSSNRNYGFVAGTGVNEAKARYYSNYQGLRTRLNAGQSVYGGVSTARYFGSGPDGANLYRTGGLYGNNYGQYSMNNSAMNGYMKGQVIGSMIFEGIEMLNNTGVLDKIFGNSGDGDAVRTNSNKLENAFGTIGSGIPNVSSSEASSAMSKMAACTDSVSLREAISGAKGTLYNMQANTAALESAAEQCKSKIPTMEKGVDTAKGKYKEAKSGLSTAQQTVRGQEAKRDNCLNKVAKADSKYGAAVENYTKAHDQKVTAENNHKTAQQATARAQQQLNSAEQTLANTPETITVTLPDGSTVERPNPAYQQAKQAVENARTQLQQAQQKEQEAKQKLDAATQQEAKAEQQKEDAYKQLGDTKAAVDAAEKELKEAQKGVDTAKDNEQKAQNNMNIAEDNYNQAQRVLESNEGIVEKAKTATKDCKKFKKEIEDQEDRLDKLEKKEQKRYDKYDNQAQTGINKNDNRHNSINGEVDTRKERRTVRRMERTNDKVADKIANRDAYATQVKDSAYIENELNSPNNVAFRNSTGQEYREIQTPSGDTLYYKDKELISQEEFETARAQA